MLTGGERMTGIMGASASGEGLLNNTVIVLLLLGVVVFFMFKLYAWAKKFTLSAGIKKIVYILTGAGFAVFNGLYYKGNAMIAEEGNWQWATLALVISLIWMVIFSFVLCAQTKEKS